MTKHRCDDKPNRRDRPELEKLKERAKRIQRARDILAQSTQCIENRPLLQRPFAEQYRNGLIKIACVFEPSRQIREERFIGGGHNDNTGVLVGLSAERDRFSAFMSQNYSVALGKGKCKPRGQEKLVLVSDVQSVEVVNVETATFEGLHIANNEFDNVLMGLKTIGVSSDGLFKLFPSIKEWEFYRRAPLTAIGLDHNPVSVIEADPEVMNSIADDSGGVARKAGAKLKKSPIPNVRISLGHCWFDVIVDVIPENIFELRDVVIGPFNL